MTRSLGNRARLRQALIVSFIMFALCCSLAGPLWWVLARSQSGVAPGQPVQIDIPAGSSTEEIGELLADAGVVDNATMFVLQARVSRAEGELEAGIYDFRTGTPYRVVIDRLKDGPPIKYVTVVIPEGWTIERIGARLESQLGIPSSEFVAVARTGAGDFHREYLNGHGGSLEGYLFPKTYRFREGSSPEEVIEMMLTQFERETQGLDLAYPRDRDLSLHQVVTIASMIEMEAKLDRERPVIASVIYNRLRRDMPLEIDATIEYVLPGHRFRLRNQDLKLDSRYNTYLYKGLPPTPISSPGLASLKAAAKPAETRYIYYVLTGKDGAHTFTITWAEFEDAKALSKRVFGR